ncbi:MAG: hypothetical protein M0R39_02540 [Prolixibacteraceae bacterium]|nr:hypothetical protein [Prolixibacteraceae bacterium]
MALLVNSHFAVFQSFGLWRVRNSPDLTSRSLHATDMKTANHAWASAQIGRQGFG